MPILFSAVASENKLSAKYASCDGNFEEIAGEMLLKIPSRNEKMTYSHGHYLLHYIADTHNFYFCVTDKTCQRSRAFLYLNEIQRRYTSKHENDFTEILADEMYRYNEDYSTIVIRKGEVDEVNSIGVGDSETLLGEKILFINNPEELRYRMKITHIDVLPQTPVLETISSRDPDVSSRSEEKARELQETWSDKGTQTTENPENKPDSPKFLYYVATTVILILMWLALSSMGPLSLVAVACICILSVTKFSKSKNC